MENQHRKIAGYGELSQADIDLINEIKQAEARVLALHAKVTKRIVDQLGASTGDELKRIHAAEAPRWGAIAKTDLQTGFMALMRAVAQPQPVEVQP
ncbi:Acb2/Tad1 domain-containing protein [Achromobacter sp. AGC39]